MKENKERTNVCFSWPTDLVEQLKTKSRETHVPQSVLASLALAEYLKRYN